MKEDISSRDTRRDKYKVLAYTPTAAQQQAFQYNII